MSYVFCGAARAQSVRKGLRELAQVVKWVEANGVQQDSNILIDVITHISTYQIPSQHARVRRPVKMRLTETILKNGNVTSIE